MSGGGAIKALSVVDGGVSIGSITWLGMPARAANPRGVGFALGEAGSLGVGAEAGVGVAVGLGEGSVFEVRTFGPQAAKKAPRMGTRKRVDFMGGDGITKKIGARGLVGPVEREFLTEFQDSPKKRRRSLGSFGAWVFWVWVRTSRKGFRKRNEVRCGDWRHCPRLRRRNGNRRRCRYFW